MCVCVQCKVETVIPVAAEEVRGAESENKVTVGKADPVKESEGNVSEGKVTEGSSKADPVNPMPAEQVLRGSESKNKRVNSANISSPCSPDPGAPVGALDADVVPGFCVCVLGGRGGGARERGMDLVMSMMLVFKV
jgi:hypothetical protein